MVLIVTFGAQFVCKKRREYKDFYDFSNNREERSRRRRMGDREAKTVYRKIQDDQSIVLTIKLVIIEFKINLKLSIYSMRGGWC